MIDEEEIPLDRKAAIAEYIKNEIMRNKNAKLGDNEDLLSAGILDSLAILQLVAYIEKAFGIQVPDEDVVYDNFKSVNALVTYLQQF
jgi:acyl carrier protein